MAPILCCICVVNPIKAFYITSKFDCGKLQGQTKIPIAQAFDSVAYDTITSIFFPVNSRADSTNVYMCFENKQTVINGFFNITRTLINFQ